MDYSPGRMTNVAAVTALGLPAPGQRTSWMGWAQVATREQEGTSEGAGVGLRTWRDRSGDWS